MELYCTNSQSSPLITVTPKYAETIIDSFGILFKFILPFVVLFIILHCVVQGVDCVTFLQCVMFLKSKEYIAQSSIVAPTYAILLHKPTYCAIILSV